MSLTLQAAGSRKFFLDFSSDNLVDCAPNTACLRPELECLVPNSQFCDPHRGLTSGTTDNVFSIDEPGSSLLDIEPGDMEDRLVFISFRDNAGDVGNAWGLIFSKDDCLGSDDVAVARTGETWRFEPIVPMDAMLPRACLTRAKNGKHGPQILQGLYEVPFGFLVTRLD